MKFLRTLAVIFSALAVVSCGDGQSSDNGYERGPWVYVGGDGPDYVVNLVSGLGVDRNDKSKIVYDNIALKTKMSRELLTVCNPYTRSVDAPGSVFNVNRLPDEIFCELISFAIYYDDGSVWPRSRTYADLEKAVANRSKPDPLIFGKLTNGQDFTGVDLQRYFVMKADVYVTGPNWRKRYAKGSTRRQKQVGSYEGFEVYNVAPSSWFYFFDDAPNDGIFHVSCVSRLEKALPTHFCEAHFRVTDKLAAKVDFIDFRLHGGRLFLQERIRAWKKHMCPILKCSEQALNEAKVVGGF